MSDCKYVILIPDGCADWAVESLGNRTPLQAANLPNIRALAKRGIVGRSNNVPEGLSPGSDVATLGLLGCNPKQFYTGRAPLEAAAQGIELGESDWAIRCNLVTVSGGIMQSFTAGHISSEEAAEIIGSLNEAIPELRFYAGVSYRNLAVSGYSVSLFDETTQTFPPHDYTDKPVTEALPKGKGSELLRIWMDKSRTVLTEHPVNKKRTAAGKPPAAQVWLWGLGQRPKLPLFKDRKNAPQTGAMITAVDLLRGIAKNIGWDIVDVPGATGYVDTDYAAKGRYAAEALKTYGIVCVHIEATDEAGHEGDAKKKVKALEDIDSKTLPPILEALQQYDRWKLFISPDHPTPCALKTHTAEFVPWLLVDNVNNTHSSQTYDEETARNAQYHFDNGYEMMQFLMNDYSTL